MPIASAANIETTANFDRFIFPSPLLRRATFALFVTAGAQIAGNEFEPGRHLPSRVLSAP